MTSGPIGFDFFYSPDGESYAALPQVQQVLTTTAGSDVPFVATPSGSYVGNSSEYSHQLQPFRGYDHQTDLTEVDPTERRLGATVFLRAEAPRRVCRSRPGERAISLRGEP